MRKNWLLATSLVLVLVILGLAGCRAGKTTTASGNQVATVQRGNLKINVTATGNLALSHTEDLAFPTPAGIVSGGTGGGIAVEKVMVSAGDQVTAGQELAKLDTLAWEKQLKTLRRTLETAQRNLVTAERQVLAKEMAVRQAELDIQTAQDNLNKIAEVKAAQDEIDNAETTIKAIQIARSLVGDYISWGSALDAAKQGLAQAMKDLQKILAGTSITVSSNVTLQIAIAKSQLQIEQAQRQMEDAQIAVKNAQLDRDNAAQDVKDAQRDLDEAQSLSPIIKAPFAGFITVVNVKGGEVINKGAVAMTLVDPTKFEANILVSETDIAKVRLNGEATVQVDAISRSSFPAMVTSIAPTATIQSGVVNYRVKVELQSLPPVSENRSAQRPSTSENQSGQRSLASGNQSGQRPPASGNQSGQQRFPATSGSPALSALTLASQLRQGLSVTVTILVEQRTNVLLVPNRAITRRSGQSLVQVQQPDGTNQERVIKAGASDFQYTEVTEGLSEGEKVVIPQTTSPTSTTPIRTPGFPGGGLFGR